MLACKSIHTCGCEALRVCAQVAMQSKLMAFPQCSGKHALAVSSTFPWCFTQRCYPGAGASAVPLTFLPPQILSSPKRFTLVSLSVASTCGTEHTAGSVQKRSAYEVAGTFCMCARARLPWLSPCMRGWCCWLPRAAVTTPQLQMNGL